MWAEVQWRGLFMSRSYTFSNNRSFFAFKSSSSDRVIVSRSRTDDDERPLVSLLSLPRCCRVLALWSWFSISLFVISCCMVAPESCCSKVWLEKVSSAAKNVYANNPGPSISSSSPFPPAFWSWATAMQDWDEDDKSFRVLSIQSHMVSTGKPEWEAR